MVRHFLLLVPYELAFCSSARYSLRGASLVNSQASSHLAGIILL